MRRLRESWLALGGSALIIALSVSSALGAKPALDAIDSVGEQVAAFARGVNVSQNETADEPEGDEVAVDTDADTLGEDEEATDEEADEDLEPGDEGFDWTSIGHGECVSWHAHQDENADSDEDTSDEEGTEDEESDEPPAPGDEGYDWQNHGEFVSYWARIGCNEEPDDEEADEEACEDEAVDTDEDTLGDDEEAAEEDSDEEACEEATDEEADDGLEPGDEGFDWTTVSHGFCVSWHAHQDETSEENAPEDGGDWRNHGEFVSHWAQEGCRTAPDDSDEAEAEADDEDSEAKAAAKAERKAEKAERKAERRRNK